MSTQSCSSWEREDTNCCWVFNWLMNHQPTPIVSFLSSAFSRSFKCLSTGPTCSCHARKLKFSFGGQLVEEKKRAELWMLVINSIQINIYRHVVPGCQISPRRRVFKLREREKQNEFCEWKTNSCDCTELVLLSRE